MVLEKNANKENQVKNERLQLYFFLSFNFLAKGLEDFFKFIF